ncbi:putative membrane protein YccC [Neorhizobium galegae]|uniref:FUSC family protein n=1 Tax=Neorhizobium galegae TaxID=399 RepID=UPI001AEA3DB9|nr:FUSC family protein [Neorhizobium galegae]MBP2550350.1 putative membrane protein YccC [Neorhizobium galegae]
MTLNVETLLSGFDRQRLLFCGRTAIAGCLAMLVAFALGLHHPQWAAMTIWVVAQPTRGLWLEKSLSRIAGTLIGAGIGTLMVIFLSSNPPLLLVCLALWIGFCATTGNLLRGPLSYVTLLAGYSAAMIAMLDHDNPNLVLGLAQDRILTILIGAATSTLTGLLFTPKSAESNLHHRIRQMVERVTAHVMDHASNVMKREERAAILSELAAIDESLEVQLAGKIGMAAKMRAVRSVLAAAMDLLLNAPEDTHRDSDEPSQGPEALACSSQSDLARRMASLQTAWQGLEQAGELEAQRIPSLHLHRDWIGARQAGLRAALSVLGVGAIWLLTDLAIGPFMVMGTAIMTSLFSTFDHPARIMRFGIVGTLAGASVATVVRLYAMPLAESELAMVLMVMPVILIGALVMSHRKSMFVGMDFNMVSLLLLGPAFPTHLQPAEAVAQAMSVVVGPVVALLAFTYAFPVHPQGRMRLIIRMIVHDLQNMADTGTLAPHRVEIWRARLYHRILRLIRWSEKSGGTTVDAAEGGLLALRLGEAVANAQSLVSNDNTPASLKQAGRTFLKSLAKLQEQPGRTATALEHFEKQLSVNGLSGSRSLAGTASRLSSSEAFFRQA